jgi:hypothetical protein
MRISPRAATFEERGFSSGEPQKQERLEKIGRTFIAGYNAALEADSFDPLVKRLGAISSELRGFAYEGAAMAFSLLDQLLPAKQSRFSGFLAGPGEPHAYMLHVGAGWATARLPWLRLRLERSISRYDPLLRWLVVDGLGFHEGYFSWHKVGREHRVPRPVTGYARRAFDHGLGRSIWFACCADVGSVREAVDGFESARRPDLWSGIGLAVAYAGGAGDGDLAELRDAAGDHLPAAAQGAAFAAKARSRAGNPAAHTDRTCVAFCGMSARDAAAVTDTAIHNLQGDNPFELWRERIQREFLMIRR